MDFGKERTRDSLALSGLLLFSSDDYFHLDMQQCLKIDRLNIGFLDPWHRRVEMEIKGHESSCPFSS